MTTPRMPMSSAGTLLRSVEDALREILDRSDFGDPGSFAFEVLQEAMDGVTLIRQAAEQAGLIEPARVNAQLTGPTPEQLEDFAAAHVAGMHEFAPREFCPDCKPRRSRAYEVEHCEHRPDDLPEPGDRCKDCGVAITWMGPGPYDWAPTADAAAELGIEDRS